MPIRWEAAQQAKLKLICEKLQLHNRGCVCWISAAAAGAVCLYMALYGVSVVGVNDLTRTAKKWRRRVAKVWMSPFSLEDYRDLNDPV
ncbi:class I SAM-dependent methyltransferase [Salmonella enterica subsp. enterica]|nr:class I SAM-dependent methyltransferase [Salmonella enterica subsp. enterica]